MKLTLKQKIILVGLDSVIVILYAMTCGILGTLLGTLTKNAF